MGFVNDPDFSEQLITNSLYGLSAEAYDIAIVDSNGCIENIQHEILEPAVLTAQAFTNSPLCHGEDNGNADIVISGGTADFSFTNITPFSNFYSVKCRFVLEFMVFLKVYIIMILLMKMIVSL